SLFPYTTLFRSHTELAQAPELAESPRSRRLGLHEIARQLVDADLGEGDGPGLAVENLEHRFAVRPGRPDMDAQMDLVAEHRAEVVVDALGRRDVDAVRQQQPVQAQAQRPHRGVALGAGRARGG